MPSTRSAILVTSVTIVLASAACRPGAEPGPPQIPPSDPARAGHPSSEHAALKDLCIAQYVAHPALDEVRTAFEGEVARRRLAVKAQVLNANGDATTARTIADQFCAGECEVVFALATPMAQSIAQSCKSTPWVFGAITDPVSAGLVDGMEKPGRGTTGTSDQWPYGLQMDLIAAMWGPETRVGVPFNPSEANTAYAMTQTREAAERAKLTLVEVPANSLAEVRQAVESLRGRVDVVYVPADNTVMAAASAVVAAANELGLPVIAGDSGTFKAGATVGLGVSYANLGVLNAGQVEKILGGVDAGSLPVETSTGPELYLDESRLQKVGKDPAALRAWYSTAAAK